VWGFHRRSGLCKLAISQHHARRAGEMNIAHKHPFNSFLIAQQNEPE
jgi:PIN domain nuclease of toxin-antitoxin system